MQMQHSNKFFLLAGTCPAAVLPSQQVESHCGSCEHTARLYFTHLHVSLQTHTRETGHCRAAGSQMQAQGGDKFSISGTQEHCVEGMYSPCMSDKPWTHPTHAASGFVSINTAHKTPRTVYTSVLIQGRMGNHTVQAALESGSVTNGTLTENAAQSAAVWRVREGLSEALQRKGEQRSNLVSVCVPMFPSVKVFSRSCSSTTLRPKKQSPAPDLNVSNKGRCLSSFWGFL